MLSSLNQYGKPEDERPEEMDTMVNQCPSCGWWVRWLPEGQKCAGCASYEYIKKKHPTWVPGASWYPW